MCLVLKIYAFKRIQNSDIIPLNSNATVLKKEKYFFVIIMIDKSDKIFLVILSIVILNVNSQSYYQDEYVSLFLRFFG